MKRKYLIQGDLDGACFLYSIANSVVALSSRKPTIKQWSNALQYIPFSTNFIDGQVGTQNYDDQHEIYKFAVKQAISEYSPTNTYEISTFPQANDINEIHDLVSENSVTILNISGHHWVCVVEIDKANNHLLTACSDITDRVDKYKEKKCGFNRFHNRIYELNKQNQIYPTSVIKITIIK